MAADPGVAVDGGPASRDNVVAPNGAGFKLTTPLGPGQSVELPARVHVGAASGPGTGPAGCLGHRSLRRRPAGRTDHR